MTCGGGRRVRRRTCVRNSVTVQCTGRPVDVQKCGKAPCQGLPTVCCKSHKYLSAFVSLPVRAYVLSSISQQPNVSTCALRAVQVRTAASVCVTLTFCMEKSTV